MPSQYEPTQYEQSKHHPRRLHMASSIGPRLRVRSRRVFLADLGRGAVAALAIPVFAACADEDDPATTTADDDGDGATSTASSSRATEPSTGTTPETATGTSGAPASPTVAGTWERVVLGGVSAYVLVRDGEAAVVDTGNPGSSADIEAALSALGVAWGDVGHVVVTHRHPDHQGSLPQVMELAADAMAYCGEGDLEAMEAPRPLTAVAMGDEVFGLEVIETPGHTLGHISVLDRAASVLVAGDALNGAEGGGVAGPNERFTPDMDTAWTSVEVLAGYEFQTLYFGHGDPVMSGASEAVAELVASQR